MALSIKQNLPGVDVLCLQITRKASVVTQSKTSGFENIHPDLKKTYLVQLSYCTGRLLLVYRVEPSKRMSNNLTESDLSLCINHKTRQKHLNLDIRW